MDIVREEIRKVVEQQYEDGFRTVIDIDILTDKILTVLNSCLDLDLEVLYDRP